ncbi:MAG: hypothetical protein HY660_05445 [Armatimonadetes bacterium]|nr:hypothetical protein [Armatimonadota bacterium]
MLSHQTTARQEDIAAQRLWARYHTLERAAAARPGQIEPLIHNVGISTIKARRICLIARALRRRWGHERRITRFLRTAPVIEAQRELMDLPGVGPKSAAIMLLMKFDKPMFPVDTNILRVARALGWVRPRGDAEEVRGLVERLLPHDPRLYRRAHALLLVLGRATQRGKRPDLIVRLRGTGPRTRKPTRASGRRSGGNGPGGWSGPGGRRPPP